MNRVIVFSTVHGEAGMATTGGLLWFLTRLRPDVLFIEHSPVAFPAFMDGSLVTPESVAVRRYREITEVEVAPVDLVLQVAGLKSEFDWMFDRIAELNVRYCELSMLDRYHLDRGGLAYLNSAVGAGIHADIGATMRATVNAAGDSSLTGCYTLWTEIQDRRERSMIDTIEEFARHRSFKKGVLLVGAAHRLGLVEKLGSGEPADSCVRWDPDWWIHEDLIEPPLPDSHTSLQA